MNSIKTKSIIISSKMIVNETQMNKDIMKMGLKEKEMTTPLSLADETILILPQAMHGRKVHRRI